MPSSKFFDMETKKQEAQEQQKITEYFIKESTTKRKTHVAK